MSLLDDTRRTTDPDVSQEATGVRGALGATAAVATTGVLVVAVATWHLTQGTSAVDADDLIRLALGSGDQHVLDVLTASRLPRMLAGLAVGVALGAAGALFQSLARNNLAAPDTLAVNAGAYFVIVLVTALGITLPVLGEGLLAFTGGLAAATAVLLLGGGGGSTTRLILAGSALTLALAAATAALLLLFDQETVGLYAWGSGSLTQLDLSAVRRMGPVILLALAAGMLLARRLDLLTLGDDSARVLGVHVLRTRVLGTGIAVILASAAVTLAGPIGFVGLCAPAGVRLLVRAIPAVARHRILVPLSALAGALIVLLADIVMRLAFGPEAALAVPTGVATTLLGAFVLVLLARRAGDAGPLRQPPAARTAGAGQSPARRIAVIAALLALLGATALLGVMAGYTWLRTGDLLVWARGDAIAVVRFAMDERAPRVAAALLAGAALALSGTVVQAVCRNPLAEPGLLGITGGAGVAAVLVVTTSGAAASTASIAVAAGIGALLAFALVYGLSWRGGLDSDRLVLVGIGVWFGTTALTTLLIVRANPWDTPRIFTWLSGSTYDRSWAQVLPVLIALLVALPLAWAAHRELDLLAVDDDTPRVVGIRLERLRLVVLLAAALLASTAVSAVGVVGFVGLVAPHAARALMSSRHVYVVPVAVLLGSVLLSLADTLGRSVLAPAQVPAGLVVALIGAPYFLYLLYRSRA
ncbi:MAG: iron transporter permease [Nocardioidaceae bacterium]|nr:iron transporter permease [Nocardioidaceae bacterium]